MPRRCFEYGIDCSSKCVCKECLNGKPPSVSNPPTPRSVIDGCQLLSVGQHFSKPVALWGADGRKSRHLRRSKPVRISPKQIRICHSKPVRISHRSSRLLLPWKQADEGPGEKRRGLSSLRASTREASGSSGASGADFSQECTAAMNKKETSSPPETPQRAAALKSAALFTPQGQGTQTGYCQYAPAPRLSLFVNVCMLAFIRSCLAPNPSMLCMLRCVAAAC